MISWQDMIVLCLIAAAGLYLARSLWFRISKRGSAGCDACPGCSATSEPKSRGADAAALQQLPSSRRPG